MPAEGDAADVPAVDQVGTLGVLSLPVVCSHALRRQPPSVALWALLDQGASNGRQYAKQGLRSLHFALPACSAESQVAHRHLRLSHLLQVSKTLSGVTITADATQPGPANATAPQPGVRKRVAIAAEAAVDPASVKIPNHPKSESVLRVLGQPPSSETDPWRLE